MTNLLYIYIYIYIYPLWWHDRVDAALVKYDSQLSNQSITPEEAQGFGKNIAAIYQNAPYGTKNAS